jgi:hypothetical protein
MSGSISANAEAHDTKAEKRLFRLEIDKAAAALAIPAGQSPRHTMPPGFTIGPKARLHRDAQHFEATATDTMRRP